MNDDIEKLHAIKTKLVDVCIEVGKSWCSHDNIGVRTPSGHVITCEHELANKVLHENNLFPISSDTEERQGEPCR